MNEQMTDSAIIKLLQGGKQLEENRVFAYLFKRYKQEMLRYMSKKGLPATDDAEEIFHDALLTLRAKAITGTFDLGQKNAVRAYLYAVCSNLANKKWRTAYKDKELTEGMVKEVSEEGTLNALIDKDKKEFFLYLVSSLGEKCKKILTKRMYLKHKHEDIAEDLGYASAQVSRNKTFACIRKLKTKLQSLEDWQSRIF